MVVSLLLVLNFSIGLSAVNNYDRQEADTCKTISQRLSVKTSYEKSNILMKDAMRLTKASDMEFHTTSRDMADEFCGRYDDGGFPMCFVAGTKVKTSEGDKNIEYIEEGDYVLSENPDTGEQEYKKVLQTFVNEKRILVHVYVEDEEIITTDGHPFYVEGTGFIPSEELRNGDILRLADGRTAPVISIEIEYLDEPISVYNFEVEDSHTYYVSELGVLVHNTGCPGDTSANVEKIVMLEKAGKGGSGYSKTTRRQAFRQAKEAAGIPKSAQYKTHKFVYDGSSENRIVYEFEVNGESKYIIEHPYDKMGRGNHFHGADALKGSPFDKGRYNQYDGHFPEDFDGFY